MKFIVIGIDDNQNQDFNKEILDIISSHQTFSGGNRHYEIVSKLLPKEHIWIEIIVPLSDVFAKYKKYSEVVVFASGDPLFFGFANTIQREMPEADIILYASFNSLQLLCHRLLMPYQDMHIVSLTGRSWHKFDEALILGHDMIGVLTDKKEHTPSKIAQRMLNYGYDNYSMYVGELLGNKEKEKTSVWKLNDIINHDFSFPNNIILQKNENRLRPFGIPESDFELLDGRSKMITKMPIRLLSLSLLDLRNKMVFWDIGFCTGSVSVEAKLQFPHLQIISFEQRDKGLDLIHKNSQKFGTPGITPIIGDFTEIDISNLPTPDAVFIGGHGGKLDKMMPQIVSVLSHGGNITFNSVSTESKDLFLEQIKKNNLRLKDCITVKIDDYNTIDVMKAIKE